MPHHLSCSQSQHHAPATDWPDSKGGLGPKGDKAPSPFVCSFWGWHQSCSLTTHSVASILKSTDLILRLAKLRQERICSVIPAVLAECTQKAPSARLARQERGACVPAVPALPGPRYKHSKGSSRPKTTWRQHRWDLFPTRAKDAPPNLIYSIKTACPATLPNTKSRPFSIINFLNLFRALSNSLILLQVDTEQWMGLDPHNTKAAIIFSSQGAPQRQQRIIWLKMQMEWHSHS